MDLDSEWQRGPDLLQKPLQDWPIKADEITRRNVAAFVANAYVIDTLVNRIDLSRFSKFTRLINATARVLSLNRIYEQD